MRTFECACEQALFNCKYNNFIPLGTRCHLANDLIYFGQRIKSYPFDWLVCNYELVKDFFVSKKMPADIFEGDKLWQSSNHPNHYYDYDYDLWFAHDFNEFESLTNQLRRVKRKYNKRSKRLFRDIKKPSLFLRYIESQEEIDYVEKNYDAIRSCIKFFNIQNEIIFITTDVLQCREHIFLFTKCDEVHTSEDGKYRYILSKQPIQNNDILEEYFESLPRKDILFKYRFVYFIKKLRKMFKRALDKLFRRNKKRYYHSNIVNFG